MSQIPFTFDHREAFGGEDFLVSPCNGEAVQWVERWPHWPQTVLMIVGPKAAGKTHLARVFQGLSGAKVVSIESLKKNGPDGVLQDQPALVLEDIERFIDAGLSQDLFHLYNLAAEQGLKILMTGTRAPARISIALKDLSSRLNTASVTEIKAPDDALLSALIVKQFSDRQLMLEQDVLAYMLTRMGRSFEGVQQLVTAIDALSLAEKRAITIPLVRRVLEMIFED